MRAPRKDQVRNRQRLVAAARAAFTEHGPEASLDEVARRAGVGPTTLYRHFTGKEELIEAVLDDLVEAVREKAALAAAAGEPEEAFRAAFTETCDLSEAETVTFARLANAGDRSGERAQRLIESVLRPATERLQAAGGLRSGIEVSDIAAFVRMTLSAENAESRLKAVETLLDGLTRVR